ncbi:MAG: S41 family peptidase, partial [FCB group bacterium]|nr:S41 family peptidase [FCB group bacterium]
MKTIKTGFLLVLIFAAFLSAQHKSKSVAEGARSVQSTVPTQELLDMYESSFEKLKNNYVDEIDQEKVVKASIKGLFKPLDPYTVLLEGSRKDRLEMLTRGKYGGVGIQISIRRDTLIVLSPMEDSPAYSEGIQAGDKIIMIDSTATKGMSISDASDLIRGEIGSVVKLTIWRPSTKEKLVFELTRDNIRLHDVPYAGVDSDGIGYIRITKFSKNTSKDFHNALKTMVDEGTMKALVIDLRGNSGGLLRNALTILDDLVPRNVLLLTTKGRNQMSNREMYSRRNPVISEDIPIAVLINHSSASASEIVAGVLQDLDRAVIVGKKSFGKGLVQSMFSINDSTKLKITTAKYYTPSGRLIQKMDYLKNGALTDGLDKHDSTFYTMGGRIVKGGGGITPDVTVEPEKIPPFVQELWRQGLFLTFAATYVPMHNISEPVHITQQILDDFEKFLQEYHFDYNEPGEREFNKMKDILAEQVEFRTKAKRGFLAK